MSRVDTFFLGFFTGSILLAVAISVSGTTAEQEKQRAITAGVAHWTVNPTTGEKKFEYLAK